MPLVSLVALVSNQRIHELLRFICGRLLLRCQVALVPNEKLVDTVGGMLVDVTHPNLHFVGRFLVRRIIDYDDVLCVPAVASRGRPETLLFQLSVYTGIFN